MKTVHSLIPKTENFKHKNMKETTPSTSYSILCRPRKRQSLNSTGVDVQSEDEHGHGLLLRNNVWKSNS